MGHVLWNPGDLELIAGPNRLRRRRSTQDVSARGSSRVPSAADGGPAMSSATSDAASAPVTPLMGGRVQDRTVEAASGAAGLPWDGGLNLLPSRPARPTAGDLMLRDLLAALRKLGVIS